MRKLSFIGCLLALTLTLSAWDFSSSLDFGYIVNEDDYAENARKANISVTASPDEVNSVSLKLEATTDAVKLAKLELTTQLAESVKLTTTWNDDDETKLGAALNLWLLELGFSFDVDPAENDYDSYVKAVVGPLTGKVFYETNGVDSEWQLKQDAKVLADPEYVIPRYDVRTEGLIKTDVDYTHNIFTVGLGLDYNIRDTLTLVEGRVSASYPVLEVLTMRASVKADVNDAEVPVNNWEVGLGGTLLSNYKLDLKYIDTNKAVVDEITLEESDTLGLFKADLGIKVFDNYGFDVGITFDDAYKGSDTSAYAIVGATTFRVGYLDCDEYVDDDSIERNAPSVLADGGAYIRIKVSY